MNHALRIGVVGKGKVGTALIRYFSASKEMSISGYVGRSGLDGNVRETFDGIPLWHFCCIEELIAGSDVIFVTTADDSITEIVGAIDGEEIRVRDKVFIHCSGALSCKTFDPLVEKGALGYSLHPLQAFTGSMQDVEGLARCQLTLEVHDLNASDQVVGDRVDMLLNMFDDRLSHIKTEDKALYHASAVVISNYMVTLVNEGISYMKHMGFDEDRVKAMMLPLLKGTIDNIESLGCVDGLTGPIVRGDTDTIKRHLEVIDSRLDEDSQQFYRTMGLKTVDMIKDKRLDSDKVQALTGLLESGMKVEY